MEVVRVSMNIDLLVSSWMTLLKLTLEIPEVFSILMDITSMDVSHLVCAGSGIPKQATTPVKPWGGLDGCSTANAFIGGDVGGEGIFGKQAGDLTGITRKNGWVLPLGLSILVGWEVSPVVGIVSTLLAGGSSTQLDIVAEDGQWPPVGSSILRPSNISLLVIFMNSHMA